MYIVTDSGRGIELGDYNTSQGIDVYPGMGTVWYDSTDYPNLLVDTGTGQWQDMTDRTTQTIGAPVTNNSATETAGVADTGNTTDSDRLIDIVGNTKATADNLIKATAATEQVRDAVNNLAKIVAEKPEGGGGGGGSASASTIQEGTGAALNAQEEAAGEALAGADWGTPNTYEGFGEADVPQKPSMMVNLLDAFVNGHPLGHLADNAGVTAGGSACSFTVNLLNRNITFSMCPWASQIGLMGTILLGLSGIYAVFIVLGRG